MGRPLQRQLVAAIVGRPEAGALHGADALGEASRRGLPGPPSHSGPLPRLCPRVPGGWAKERFETCPRNYPANAPATMCGHVAFIEMDASMSYKSAMAYAATGDERYAIQAMGAVQAWAKTNVVFGLEERNGPLEAAW